MIRAQANVPLADVTDIVSGFAFKSDGFNTEGKGLPLIRIRDVVRGYTDTYFDGPYDQTFIVEAGDILIGMDGEFNRAKWKSGSALLNQRVCKIAGKLPHLDNGYLYHFLPSALKAIEDRTPFVTVKHLSVKDLRAVQIPLPPLDEQKRIAAILDKADQLRQKRRQAIALLDSLTRSIFLEMFGDPATNPHSFPLMKVGAIAEKYSDGPFGSNLKSEHYVEQGIRIIRLQNIGAGEFIDGDRAYITEEHFNKISKHECLPGDVLIGTLGDPNLRACVQPKWLTRALNKADCVQLRPNAHIALSEYCSCLLNQESTMRLAQGLVLGQTRGRISMGRLRDLELPIAPLPLQKQFVLRVRVHEEQRHSLQKSADNLEALFSSLQHRAFSGQL